MELVPVVGEIERVFPRCGENRRPCARLEGLLEHSLRSHAHLGQIAEGKVNIVENPCNEMSARGAAAAVPGRLRTGIPSASVCIEVSGRMGGVSALSIENFVMTGLALVEKLEVVFREIPHRMALRIPHNHRHQHQIHRGTECRGGIARGHLGGVLIGGGLWRRIRAGGACP